MKRGEEEKIKLNQAKTITSPEITPNENSRKTQSNPVFLLPLMSAFVLNEIFFFFYRKSTKKQR